MCNNINPSPIIVENEVADDTTWQGVEETNATPHDGDELINFLSLKVMSPITRGWK